MAFPTPIQMMAIPIYGNSKSGLSQVNSNIGILISKKIQFLSGIDPSSGPITIVIDFVNQPRGDNS